MKRFSHIFVSALLLFSTVGISINKHYCGEILKSIALNVSPNHCCGDEEMPSDCCHNESEHFTLEDELQLERYNLNFDLASVEIVAKDYELLLATYFDDFDNQSFYSAFKSPPDSESAIYIQVQSFLI